MKTPFALGRVKADRGPLAPWHTTVWADHQNLFIGMAASALMSAGLGIAMIATEPRMPSGLNHTVIGSLFLFAAVLKVLGLFVRSVWCGKLGLTITIITKMAMGAGLLAGYPIVTASLDRPIMYLAMALYEIAPLREPPFNPRSSKGRRP